MEDGSNFGVHLDVQASIDHNLLVPRFDLFFDPVREDVLQNGGAHVADPLFGRLLELFPVWKEWKDVCFGIDEARDVLDTETFVLWNSDVPDIWPVDGCLGTAH